MLKIVKPKAPKNKNIKKVHTIYRSGTRRQGIGARKAQLKKPELNGDHGVTINYQLRNAS